MLYALLLAGAGTHPHSFWGDLWHMLFGLLVALGAYSTFAPSEVAKELARDPGRTRWQHYLVSGVPYVVFPLIGWALVFMGAWRLGALVPVLPWAALMLWGLLLVLRERAVRPTRPTP